MDLSLILSIGIITIGIISIYLWTDGIKVISGNLKIGGIFLICAIIVIIIEESISIINLFNAVNMIIYRRITHLILILFMFLIILFRKFMIKDIQKEV